MYWSLGVRAVLSIPRLLLLIAGFAIIILKFLYWRSYVSMISYNVGLVPLASFMIPLLNLIGVAVVNRSRSFAANWALARPSLSLIAKAESARNSVLSVCKLTSPNGSLQCNRHGS